MDPRLLDDERDALRQWLTMVGADAEARVSAIALYDSASTRLHEELAAAHASGDIHAVRRLLHKLCGRAALVGAGSLARRVSDLEDAPDAYLLEDATWLAALRQHDHAIFAALDALD
jgi:HPt (histidine-containing phosphotransfer) domain-containing protein